MGNNLRWCAAIITAAWLVTEGSRVHAAPARSAAAPPNIVLIISDDQSWTDYGFMGHPDIRTPCLDRLAAESTVFPRGYVPTALCRPSLMSIVTGLYPHQHRTTGNDPAKT
ncbi:MAG: sulfatase-like hydrolase/transferase, partial [Verrucomicrobia bacterium]|nr:sulfatase-like hydrolase/transferase [Verrucomicrobiota bacterium]